MTTERFPSADDLADSLAEKARKRRAMALGKARARHDNIFVA